MADRQGNKISEVRYTLWGEARWRWELDGAGYMIRLYSSQVADSYSNIIDMGSR